MTNCYIDDVKLTEKSSRAPNEEQSPIIEEPNSPSTSNDKLSKVKSKHKRAAPLIPFETPVQPNVIGSDSPKSKSSKYVPTVTTTSSPESETSDDSVENYTDRTPSSNIEVTKVLEFDYSGMIPDMRVLRFKKKRNWDFHDPDVIRALYVEYETQAFSKWKVENLKIDLNNYPTPAIPTNRSYNLRMFSLRKKRAKVEKENRILERICNFNREIPRFEGQLRSNMTEELRRDFIRNKPSVPAYYVDHFAKYGKPPFKSHKINRCHDN